MKRVSNFSRDTGIICPTCGSKHLEPSKYEQGKIVCKNCNEVFKKKKGEERNSLT